MSQLDFMEKDTCITLDTFDNVIGSESKKEAHVFNKKQPRGVLHRAFSVFIFDEETNELLLQQRAASKITFPSVWTNTCCSHPLHGMDPPEVDTPDDVTNGSVLGTKRAAIRKLYHELGIPSDQVPIEKIKFLARIHYWAADTVTHGKDSPWGEHEIDYILFLTVPTKASITIEPHIDEVDAVKWVSKQKLSSMMSDTNLLFSPWFRIIVGKWVMMNDGSGWWDNLDETMKTDSGCDYVKIHKFDPPVEHMGGLGNAGPLFGVEEGEGIRNKDNVAVAVVGDATKKQGSYGKINVHKESKLSQLSHLDEVFAALSLLYLNPLRSNLDSEHVRNTFDASNLLFCDEILCKVSRSFAAVIRQLPSTLVVDVLVFYLILRALDTIEDDMTAFDNETKIKHLLAFHQTALGDDNPNWSMDGVGEGDERRLLHEFPKCYSVYASLCSESRDVVLDITKRMAGGMAEFVGKDLGQGTIDIKEYNRYCHFVAGLVGEGLSRLFAVSGLEEKSLAQEEHLSNSMGLFLQKTNIIRDYLEDYVDGRAFWPQSVWKKYSQSGDLGYFCKQDDPEVHKFSLHCLNDLVTNALELAPDSLSYLSKLRCKENFRFCSIPQVMAIATLDKCFHNSDVFTGVVKIRKGLSCKLINGTTDLDSVHAIFHSFALTILEKARVAREGGFEDPSYHRTVKACETILKITDTGTTATQKIMNPFSLLLIPIGVAMAFGVYESNFSAIWAGATPLLVLFLRTYGLPMKGSSLKSADILLTKGND